MCVSAAVESLQRWHKRPPKCCRKRRAVRKLRLAHARGVELLPSLNRLIEGPLGKARGDTVCALDHLCILRRQPHTLSFHALDLHRDGDCQRIAPHPSDRSYQSPTQIYMPPLRARHARPFRRCGRQLEPRRRGSTRVLCHAATRNRLHTIFARMGMRQHYVRALRLHQARRRIIVIRSLDVSQDSAELETLRDPDVRPLPASACSRRDMTEIQASSL